MEMRENFIKLLQYVEKNNLSDIHLSTDCLPMVRESNGDIVSIENFEVDDKMYNFEIIEAKHMELLLQEILSPENYEVFKKENEIDVSYLGASNTRFRVNCFRDSKWLSIAMRSIPQEVPTLEWLGLWEQIKTMCSKSKGLILLTGPTGTWKSTNLAAMVDYINSNFKRHIITIEDPIEYVFKNKQSLISQREVGMHTVSFSRAMKSCLREDPDVIIIGEMRDPDTIKTAITLAETWHLVISTLHTNDTVQTIDRIIDVFPAEQQEQIRMQLAMSLVWVLAQRLIPRNDKDARIASREILLNNDAVRNLIISWKSHQLYSVIEIGQKQGMILMDHYLAALYKKWYISLESFKAYVRDSENIDYLLQ